MLRRATEIDGALVDLLARTAAEQVDDGTGASLVGAAVTGLSAAVLDLPDPPADGTPADSDRWWDGLSAVERDRVVAEHPEWVGGRDGIPAAVRDDANRALLRTETERLDRELADATTRWQTALDVPLPPGMEGQGETREQLALRGEGERLREQRAAVGTVATVVEPSGRQLLLLDLSSGAEPRAAVVVGDVVAARGLLVEICRRTGAHPTFLRYEETVLGDGAIIVVDITATAHLSNGEPLCVKTRTRHRRHGDAGDGDWSISVDGVDHRDEDRRRPPSPPMQGWNVHRLLRQPASA